MIAMMPQRQFRFSLAAHKLCAGSFLPTHPYARPEVPHAQPCFVYSELEQAAKRSYLPTHMHDKKPRMRFGVRDALRVASSTTASSNKQRRKDGVGRRLVLVRVPRQTKSAPRPLPTPTHTAFTFAQSGLGRRDVLTTSGLPLPRIHGAVSPGGLWQQLPQSPAGRLSSQKKSEHLSLSLLKRLFALAPLGLTVFSANGGFLAVLTASISTTLERGTALLRTVLSQKGVE